jgi:hypothetical protein
MDKNDRSKQFLISMCGIWGFMLGFVTPWIAFLTCPDGIPDLPHFNIAFAMSFASIGWIIIFIISIRRLARGEL